MLAHFHHLQRAFSWDFRTETGASRDFTLLTLQGRGSDEVAVFLSADKQYTSMAVADILNGNIEGLAERIEAAMDNVNDMDVTFADFALAIACELTGADINEAYAARKAKVAAE